MSANRNKKGRSPTSSDIDRAAAKAWEQQMKKMNEMGQNDDMNEEISLEELEKHYENVEYQDTNDKNKSSQAEDEDEDESTDEEDGLVIDEELWNISYDDLNFEKEIGHGSFGVVYKGEYFGTPVAIKMLLNTDDELTKKYIQREVYALKGIHHPNIVQFMGLCKHTTGLYIVTEWVPHGDLRDLIEDTKLSWKEKISIAFDTAIVLNFIHKKNLIHRDIKPENLLIGENRRIKICDFGFTRTRKNDGRMTIAGSDKYMAPEVVLGERYDEKCDIFGFGVVLFELSSQRRPPKRGPATKFGYTEGELEKWLGELNSVGASGAIGKGVKDLIKLCTRTNPLDRPGSTEVLQKMKALKSQIEGWDEEADKKEDVPPANTNISNNGGNANTGVSLGNSKESDENERLRKELEATKKSQEKLKRLIKEREAKNKAKKADKADKRRSNGNGTPNVTTITSPSTGMSAPGVEKRIEAEKQNNQYDREDITSSSGSADTKKVDKQGKKKKKKKTDSTRSSMTTNSTMTSQTSSSTDDQTSTTSSVTEKEPQKPVLTNLKLSALVEADKKESSPNSARGSGVKRKQKEDVPPEPLSARGSLARKEKRQSAPVDKETLLQLRTTLDEGQNKDQAEGTSGSGGSVRTKKRSGTATEGMEKPNYMKDDQRVVQSARGEGAGVGVAGDGKCVVM